MRVPSSTMGISQFLGLRLNPPLLTLRICLIEVLPSSGTSTREKTSDDRISCGRLWTTYVNYEASGWVVHHVSDIWAKSNPDQVYALQVYNSHYLANPNVCLVLLIKFAIVLIRDVTSGFLISCKSRPISRIRQNRALDGQMELWKGCVLLLDKILIDVEDSTVRILENGSIVKGDVACLGYIYSQRLVLPLKIIWLAKSLWQDDDFMVFGFDVDECLNFLMDANTSLILLVTKVQLRTRTRLVTPISSDLYNALFPNVMGDNLSKNPDVDEVSISSLRPSYSLLDSSLGFEAVLQIQTSSIPITDKPFKEGSRHSIEWDMQYSYHVSRFMNVSYDASLPGLLVE
ncbi:hypothetical protein LguiA_007453 [Lonicera macranthoides]